MSLRLRKWPHAPAAALAVVLAAAASGDVSAQTLPCQRVITAEVVALDQVYTYNRFGAYNPLGMMYALKRDVVAIDGNQPLGAGNVRLRSDKRPRPLVLRANEGDCLDVTFYNWLKPAQPVLNDPNNLPLPPEQRGPRTRTASMHVNGLQYNVQTSDGSRVGFNASSLIAPGQSIPYRWYADKEGTYFIYSHGALSGGEGDGGSLVLGLFGSVNVEPKGSIWYRSQLTARELALVRTQQCTTTCGTQPSAANEEDPLLDPVQIAEIPQQEIIIDDGGGGGGGGCLYPITTCKWVFNYNALDPVRGNQPAAKILNGSNQIVHSDLNAIIDQTDPNRIAQDCAVTPTSGTCGDFREFSVFFHDELKAVQAFPELKTDPVFHGVRDGFGINYGASGAGSIILANFKGIGPAATCAECKYEEFFLTSWANGDPALLRQYTDDPSNVHHSYLGDAVKFRNIHAGPKETHIFHLHAHQWLHEPDGDNSTYLDSQTIGPGSAFTYEINYGGSGNRNLTPGDAIFHCHLYPHFAQGMWELWRVHDTFEDGSTARRLPDKEFGTTPNPAVLPMPGLGMAPLPTAQFPGYPFYLAAANSTDGLGALPGRRPPQPPLDLEFDGGLPRNVVVQGTAVYTPGTFDKHLTSAQLMFVPQGGSAAEVAAMNFHAQRTHATQKPDGSPGTFLTNGLPAAAGAPYADPCDPNMMSGTRDYRAAAVQLDLTVYQKGSKRWHDPQARINVLNDDVAAHINQSRTADPFFFRVNSKECVRFHHTNLLPATLEADDFQILTPTDTIGQHIHLVKFDVTASDGSANGWNYEDGTFAPGEVHERIDAWNAFIGDPNRFLTRRQNPWFPSLPEGLGAQTTIQRWWADPLVSRTGMDRTIRTVFTHDHFGPSSIQHHGFYAALVVEPAGSTWWDPNPSGLGQLGVRASDGGPTLWQANIVTGDLDADGKDDSYREFNLAFADFAIVYDGVNPVNPPAVPEAISADDPGTMLINYRTDPIPLRISQNNQGQVQAGGPRGDMAYVFSSRVHGDPFTQELEAYEEDRVKIRLIQGAQEEEHVFSVNGLRWPHEASDPASGWYNAQALGISEHFEFVTPLPGICQASRTIQPWEMDEWAVEALDDLYPDGGGSLTDPAVAGAVELAVAARLDGELIPNYAGEFDYLASQPVDRLAADSGKVSAIQQTGSDASYYTASSTQSSMMMSAEGTSESTSEQSYLVADSGGGGSTTASSFTRGRRERCFGDYLYQSTPLDDLWTGMWGILRSWRERRSTLRELPNNPRPTTTVPEALPRVTGQPPLPPQAGETDPCTGVDVFGNPKVVTGSRTFSLTAMAKAISYNPRAGINDPTGLLFVTNADYAAVRDGLKAPEPLILRASGGECLTVNLTNRLPNPVPDIAADDAPMPDIVPLNVAGLRASRRVSMHPQLVDVNVRTGDGATVGFNPDQTVRRNQTRAFKWYVPFDLRAPRDPGSILVAGPESLGGTNIRDFGDVIKHGSQGLWAGLMLEPAYATFSSPVGNSAVVTKNDGTSFKEFVLFYQDGLNLRDRAGNAVPNFPGLPDPGEVDPEDSGEKGFNYKSEPFWARLCPLAGGVCDFTAFDLNEVDQSDVLNSNVYGDPATPIFHAYPGDPLRFRLLEPDGRARQKAWALHAHAWRHEPSNPTSMILGAQGGMGVMRHFNVQPLYGAGGLTGTPGDYLYREMASFQFSGGLWGILRVDPNDPCVTDPSLCDPCATDPYACDPCFTGPCQIQEY
jgi:hypothetical protein